MTRERVDSAVVPILSIEESRAMEARLLPNEQLQRIALHKAGHLLAKAIEEDFTEIACWSVAPRILVLAGKGHNSGDALIAAGDLLQRFPHALLTVLWEGDRKLYPLVREVWHNLQDIAGKRIHTYCLSDEPTWMKQRYTLLIDGVFGLGFRSPLPDSWLRILTKLGEQRIAQVCVSVDLPSGMDDLEGCVPLAVDFTYLMGIAKWPLFKPGASQYAGRIRYLDIGFWNSGERNLYSGRKKLVTENVLRPLLQPRKACSDKRHYSRVGIVAGSHRYPGAALLATTAALQAGAGLVTAVVPEDLVSVFASQAPEAIWMSGDTTPEGTLSLESLRDILAASAQWDVMVIGPGLSANQETLCLAMELIRQFQGALVLDADVLRPELARVLQERSTSAGPVVLLPHAGEWQRIQNGVVHGEHEMQEWAKGCRCVLVLKGAVTHLTDGSQYWVSTRGGPVLSRGGSGDMLAGITGALLGRWAHDYSALEIAGMAVCWHGLSAEFCARQHGENAVRNRQLLDYLAPVLRTHSKYWDEGEGCIFDIKCH
jgi:hydroxyethylthiazole kinase-like uncharacterized protein yjeF